MSTPPTYETYIPHHVRRQEHRNSSIPFALVLPTSRMHSSPPSPASRAASAPLPNSRSTSHSSSPLLPPLQQHSRCVPRNGTAPRKARDVPRVPRILTRAWRVLRFRLPPLAVLDARPRRAHLPLRSMRSFTQLPRPTLDADSAYTLPFMVSGQFFAARAHIVYFALQNFFGPRCGRGAQTAVLHLVALDASPAVRCSG
jgi:hypothetical protein